MKAEYLSCLVESVSEIFSAMLNSETTSGAVMMTSRRNSEKSVGAHIFFFGPADGVVMLSFPVNTATNVARALTCTEGTIPREMLEDCVVELVGILAARSTFRDLASSPVRIGEPSYGVKKMKAEDHHWRAPCWKFLLRAIWGPSVYT